MRHKHADLIHAWAEGAEIQFRRYGSERWVDDPEPDFCGGYEWRIKPEPKPDVVKFLSVEQGWGDTILAQTTNGAVNVCLTFDGETGKIKKAGVI